MDFKIEISRPEIVWRQVALHVRTKILNGELPPRTKLPSTAVLARQVGTDSKTVHRALTHLVKEGLITRTRKVGTHVTDRSNRLLRMGLYHAVNIVSAPNALFIRALQDEIQKQTEKAGISLQVWVDQRPTKKQTKAMTSLEDAARERLIQGIISTTADPAHTSWIRKLPIPMTTVGHGNFNSVNFDMANFWKTSLQVLKEQGCRSVGTITPYHLSDSDSHRPFLAACKELGMEVRDEWLIERSFDDYSLDDQYYEQFGYECLNALWNQASKPDGLVVYPDSMTHGVTMGLLARQVRVPEVLKVVMHKNKEIDLFCPLPVTYVASSVHEVAQGLIRQLQTIHSGGTPTRIAIQFHRVPPASSS